MYDWPENTIQTASGRAYDFLNPDPASICVEDIAHALGAACRFAGHTRFFYSVAEHSVLVSRIVEGWAPGSRYLARAALFHDAHEAYVWDAPRPIKPLLGEAFLSLAENADYAIGEALGIAPALFHVDIVKKADDALLELESEILMPRPHGRPRPDLDVWPVGYSPYAAEQLFLRRAEELA